MHVKAVRKYVGEIYPRALLFYLSTKIRKEKHETKKRE